MGKITTKTDSFGAVNGLITGVGKAGTSAFFLAVPDASGSPGIVLYDLYVSYTGTAGIYITLYDAPNHVGGTGGPTVGTGAVAQFFIKTSGFIISGWPGRQFFNGIVFIASSDAAQTSNPDAAPTLCFGYA